LLLTPISDTGLGTVVHIITSAENLPPEHPARFKFTAEVRPAIFICRGMVCAAPAYNEAELNDALSTLSLL
jgi:hypothetical protein